jgi:hypothetical protein
VSFVTVSSRVDFVVGRRICHSVSFVSFVGNAKRKLHRPATVMGLGRLEWNERRCLHVPIYIHPAYPPSPLIPRLSLPFFPSPPPYRPLRV